MTCEMDMTDDRNAAGLRVVPLRAGGALRALTRQSAAMAEFQTYWQRMRRGGDVPRRSDINPRGIEPLLSNAFIAERIAPGLARMRIAGSHLTDLMGMEVRGMPLSAFITPAHRDALSQHLVQLFDQPAMIRLSLDSPGRPGAPGLKGDMLILPLRSDLGDISRAVGCLVTEGNVGRGPRRLDITDVQITPLDGTARINSSASSADPRLGSARRNVGAISDTTAKASAPQRKAERAYLRLVKV